MGSLDPRVHVGTVNLRVSDLDSLDFYSGVLGLLVMTQNSAGVTLSADGRRPLLLLQLKQGLSPPPPGATGLFHTAIRYPTRAALADALRRIDEADLRLDGASDHGVSEALYLTDPAGAGVELYWDRPREAWPRPSEGRVAMFTEPLDLSDLLAQADPAADLVGPVDPAVEVGHVHLKVSDVERSERFYSEVVGLDVTERTGEEAAFLSAGGYHHHIGMNVWHSRGGPPPPPGTTGLGGFTLAFPDEEALGTAVERIRATGAAELVEFDDGAVLLHDPDAIAVELGVERSRAQPRGLQSQADRSAAE
ncbi:MAG: VOC family protein [Solirubrobacteraceae bacterium]